MRKYGEWCHYKKGRVDFDFCYECEYHGAFCGDYDLATKEMTSYSTCKIEYVLENLKEILE
jgi:hypothetical protein